MVGRRTPCWKGTNTAVRRAHGAPTHAGVITHSLSPPQLPLHSHSELLLVAVVWVWGVWADQEQQLWLQQAARGQQGGDTEPPPQHTPHPDTPCPSLHWGNNGAMRALWGVWGWLGNALMSHINATPCLETQHCAPRWGDKIPPMPIPPLPNTGGWTLHRGGLRAQQVPPRQLRAGQEVGSHLWATGSHSFLPAQKGPSEQQVLPAKRGIVEQTRAPCYRISGTGRAGTEHGSASSHTASIGFPPPFPTAGEGHLLPISSIPRADAHTPPAAPQPSPTRCQLSVAQLLPSTSWDAASSCPAMLGWPRR